MLDGLRLFVIIPSVHGIHARGRPAGGAHRPGRETARAELGEALAKRTGRGLRPAGTIP